MCGTEPGGRGWGAGAGGWGLGAGGYLEMSRTGSNTQMAVCREWGVYIHTYVMYVHFWHKMKFK